MTKVLAKASPALAKSLSPRPRPKCGKLKTKLAAAGFRGESAGSIFLGLKFIGLLVGLVFGGGLLLPLYGINQQRASSSVALGRLALLLARRRRLVYRQTAQAGIFLGLPDALDLMVVCVEAGWPSTRRCARWPRR